MTALAAALAYLEHGEYEATGWQRAVTMPLMELRGDFEMEHFSSFDEQCEHWCEGVDSLCSGDGFRWNPAAPTLRFR